MLDDETPFMGSAQALLHDWIKYMEMRLLSVDWSAAPSENLKHLERAILKTRKVAGSVVGIREILESRAAELEGSGPPGAKLLNELRDDAAALESMLDRVRDGEAPTAAEALEIIKTPGVRLRAALASEEEQ